MTVAKDRGLSIEDIFSYFHGGHTGIDGISREAFVNALEKLGNKLFVVTNKELDDLVTKFDLNDDGLISLAEFKKYCLFEIPHVAWKAERKRQEANGQIILLKAKIEEERRAKSCDTIYPCGEKVISTSKLFWKNDVTVNVSIFYCISLDVLTIQLWDTTMKPTDRTLRQVVIDNGVEADRVFSMLMGDEVPPRREFIEKNAVYANIDA